MIVVKRKPLEEILSLLSPHRRILIAGCNGCAAICHAGGEKEVEINASIIRLARKTEGADCEIIEKTAERQCEAEFLDTFSQEVTGCDAVLSLACGIGVQAFIEKYADKAVYPGVNTMFMGLPVEQGVWEERCSGCGNCTVWRTGGICPVTRCSKSLLNGPCGGSDKGRCEVDRENIDCAWHLIYNRLKERGTLHLIDDILPPKDWRTNRDGGVRRLIREDLQL